VACLPGLALSQPVLPPVVVDQFNHTIGRRVEALTILGGDYGAFRGVYSFKGGHLADLTLTKLGAEGEVAKPEPLGLDFLKWAPVLQANLGHIDAENQFTGGPLQGNKTEYDVRALQAGGGFRLYLNDHLSIAPIITAIYGRTENDFKPQNAFGEAVEAAASGTYVDWKIHTWSVAPALDGRYEWLWGRTRLEFSSTFTFFHTESFDSTSPVISLSGDSDTWKNVIDVDVPLGWKLFGRELHTGGYFSRTEMSGNVADGLNENHLYTVNGRLVLDTLGKIWGLRWLGVGYSYYWGGHFNGWSAGVDLRLQF
jgi:hypothetical protein